MKFRFLADHVVSGRIIPAGATEEMSLSFVPSGATEPLDGEACLRFWRVGPQPLGPVALRVAAPKTRWERIEFIECGARWKLIGLGADLPDVCG